MYKENKYTRTYNSIIASAVSRNWSKGKIPGSRERHHIIPQSLGGSDIKSNLVYLSPREHFICHWLLIKMVDGEARSKMLYALMGMRAINKYQQRYDTKTTSRVYEKYRLEHAVNHSEVMKGKPAWNKGMKYEGDRLEQQRERNKNRIIDPIKRAEGQIKRIAKVTGQKRTEETCLKISLAATGKVKGPMSDDQKQKRSAKLTGVPKKKGHGDKVRLANIGCISINKDGQEKKVKQDTIDQWLVNGWSIGGKKRK